jgi:hypothetical protein
MNHRTAPMSRSIRFLTAIILAMVVGFILGGIRDHNLLVVGVALGVITLACETGGGDLRSNDAVQTPAHPE